MLDNVFTLLATLSTEEQRRNALEPFAEVHETTVDALMEEFASYQEKHAEKLAAAQRRQERELLKARVGKLAEQANEVDTEDSDALFDFVNRVEAIEGASVRLTVADGTLAVTVDAKLPTGGGNRGGGKPAADAPQPYVDEATGSRILGPLTTWAREKLSESQLQDFGAYRPNGKLRTGKQLARALEKAGVISESPLS